MEKSTFVKTFTTGGRTFQYYDIRELENQGHGSIDRLPFSIRVLVENQLRKLDGKIVRDADVINIAKWQPTYQTPLEIAYYPARVLMQDFTGVPAVVDLASMRDAMAKLGGDPKKVNPLVPVELVVDHSVQVDSYGTEQAIVTNVKKEYERNGERYALLKWAQKSFDNFKVVPPRSGICHQVNLEHLGRVVIAEDGWAYPDTIVGLDSHTTMIDAIGVLGWGVGGIEAEAVMLGQPYNMTVPEVIGFKLNGALRPGITATDLVLTVTRILRQYGVVEKFVEFFGPGLKHLSIPDRATISNMTPEFGATLGFFPVDEKTIEYLKLTDRARQAEIVEAYTRANGLFFSGQEQPEFTDVIELDLDSVQPCISGPARPQDHIVLGHVKSTFAGILGCEYDDSANSTGRLPTCEPISTRGQDLTINGQPARITDGSIVIAAITSCTNTSNPSVLIGAGLLAKNALAHGLRVPLHVKTSLAPGSKVVMQYLEDAGLMPYLQALGFHLAAFGCTTCIGNSGPLHPEIEAAIKDKDLNVAAILSGNRNFEARIHQLIKSNFLASPMLVVAFALAGRIDCDLNCEPLGFDPNGDPVYLDDIWPKPEQIEALVRAHVKPEFFEIEYGRIFDGDEFWENLPDVQSLTYAWDKQSTYIKNPPYFDDFDISPGAASNIAGARVLAVLGDAVTTDHISPAGAIAEAYPAGQYLAAKGLTPSQFNSYGARRGNHEVMMRGTFGNIRIKNQLVAPKEGSYTRYMPDDDERFIYDAAMAYADTRTPLVVLAGKEYGAGSSRDWAAKGSRLLGVRAVIAQSFERIHRSNLVGMGVLPLVFEPGENAQSLGLDGHETIDIDGISDIAPRKKLTVKAGKANGDTVTFTVTARLDTDIEVDYYTHGGILPFVLRKLMGDSTTTV